MLSSCTHTSKDQSLVIQLDTIASDTICPLLSNYSRPACHLQISLEVPREGTPEDAASAFALMVSTLASQVSEDCEPTKSLEALVCDLNRNYICRYLSEGRDAISNYNGDVEAAANWMSYEENITGRVTWQSDQVLCYEVTNDNYTGGAHGSMSVRCGVMDLQTLTPIVFADVFAEESRLPLGQLMQARLSEEHGGLTADEMVRKGLLLNDATIEPTDNFSVTAEGIEWVFEPYEIAPYSMGVMRILVEWDELQYYVDSQSVLLSLAMKYRTNQSVEPQLPSEP